MQKIPVALMAAVLCLGCGAAAHVHKNPLNVTADFESHRRNDLGQWPVYVFSEGKEKPPVLLLHELPGFIPQTGWLAEKLQADGFSVYVPLMFGSAGGGAGRATQLFRVGLSRRWRAFRRGATPPIADDLSVLADRISREHGGGGVAVIGMCLSGNLAPALLSRNPHVVAAVAAQPSLPLNKKDDIGLTKETDIDPEVTTKKIPFLLFRFHNDAISEGKDAGFRSAFGELAHIDNLTEPPIDPPHFRHSTLTIELFNPKGDCAPCAPNDGLAELAGADRRPACAYAKTVAYLRSRLSQ